MADGARMNSSYRCIAYRCAQPASAERSSRSVAAKIAAVLLLGAHAAAAQSRPSPDSIRRLAPASFPEVPIGIRRDLERRRCLVPQPSDALAPTNVVHGAFTAAKVSEWAVLCSVRDTSRILIYRAPVTGVAAASDSLERASDVGWMQAVGDHRWGYSRMLRVLRMQRIRAWRHDVDGNAIPQPVDHDAIEQAFVGKAAEAFYHAAGRWYRQVTAD